MQNLHSLHSGVLSRSVAELLHKNEDILERDDVVPRLYIGDTLPHRLDDTGTLVAQNDRERAFGILSGKCVCIYVLFQHPALTRDSFSIPVWQTPV